MFSRTAEYALLAVVYLATNREGLRGSEEIAGATRVPAAYMSKVLKDLVAGGVVLSQRGPSGGFRLARDPGEITVLDVVNAADPIQRIHTCPLGIPTHGTNLCPLHRKLDNAIAMVEKTLGESTIAEMIEPPRGESRCTFPTVSARSGRSSRR